MRLINNLPLTGKMLLAVGLLSALAVALAGLGIDAVRRTYNRAAEITEAADRVFVAGRATANLLAYARAVEGLPSDLTDQQRAATETTAKDRYTGVCERIEELRPMLDVEEQRAKLDQQMEHLARYNVNAGKIASMARGGESSEAAKLASDIAPIIADTREALRVIEKHNERLKAEAVKSANEGYATTIRTMLWLSGGGVVLGGVLALGIALLAVARPLRDVMSVMGAIAEGKLETEVPHGGRKDEIGRIAQALEYFKQAGKERQALRVEQAEQAAQAAAERRTAVQQMAESFEASVGGVVEAVSSAAAKLEATAKELSEAAAGASEQSVSVATAAEQASASVQTVASAAEELSASVSEIGQQVHRSSDMSGRAVDEARQTGETVQSLAAAAERIGDVVRLISDIAGQTNLLALNATIEAARAGDAGKGFAVVASEVKSLAGQTARATEDIGAQVQAIQAATQQAVTAISGIGQTITGMNEVSAAIAGAVEEQGAATQEIARTVAQAAAGTGSVSENIGGVAGAVERTGYSANELLTAATALSGQSEQLKAEVAKFLATVRQAA